MQLTNDRERLEVGRLFSKFAERQDHDSLAELGLFYQIKILQTASTMDCMAYVADALGVLPGVDPFRVIERPEQQIHSIEQLIPGNSAAIYRGARGDFPKVFLHAALYLGNEKFDSIWKPGFRVTHKHDQLPLHFGNEVKFYNIDRRNLIQQFEQMQLLD